MEINVNNEKINIEENATVLQLLQQVRGEKLNGVAVAVNNTVVPRSQWEKTQLTNNINVLIIQATQGG